MSRPEVVQSGGSGSRDVRCHCGNLVARITEGRIEIKCRRCQRIGLIDMTKSGAHGATVDVQWLAGGARATSK
jgi:phage FluMu protein Com